MSTRPEVPTLAAPTLRLLLGEAAARGREVSLNKHAVKTRDGHTGARKDCGKYTRTTGVTRGHCLVHRIMSHAHLTQNDVGHRRHRNALRQLIV